jgi:hypothetical protein
MFIAKPLENFEAVVRRGIVDDDDLIGRWNLFRSRPHRFADERGMVVVGKHDGKPDGFV